MTGPCRLQTAILCSCLLGAIAESARADEPAQLPSHDSSDDPFIGRQEALSSAGGVGLPGIPSAASSGPYQLRTAIFLRGFVQSDYLIAGDRNSLIAGGLQFDVGLGRYVEVWLLLGASANHNERMQTDQQDPPLILSLGDVTLGAKGHIGYRGLHLGLQPTLSIRSSGGDLGSSFATTSPGIDLLGTADIRRFSSRVPLRFYGQLGYFHDRSDSLLADKGCPTAVSATSCTYSRIVTMAAYDIRQPRVRFAVGADLPFVMTPQIELGPLIEYHLEGSTGAGSDAIRSVLAAHGVTGSQLDGRVAQWLTLGARLHLRNRLSFDVAFVAGLSSAGFALSSPTPQFSGYGALTWAADLVPKRQQRHPASTQPPPPPFSQLLPAPTTGPVPVQTAQGRIRGVVRDSKTGQPVSGAVVRFPGRRVNALLTDDRGEYETGYFPAGPVVLESYHTEYDKHRTDVVVVPGQTVQVDLSLSQKPETAVKVRIDVLDDRGQPIPANIVFTHAGDKGKEGQRVEAPPDIAGGFMADLFPGAWRVRIDSDGYLSREEPVVIGSSLTQKKIVVVVRRRPQAPSVRLGPDHILLKGILAFQPTTAELTPQSILLLDEVADLLLRHPELRRIRVEGHTDNVGKPEVNQQLSDERAATVRDYLIRQGVGPDRLVAQGFGASQPLLPNLTMAARLKNRRVDFRILERAAGK